MRRDRASWLTPVFLIFGVLAPTGCILWFMNQTVRSEAESARQSVKEAWRGQLRFLRDQVEGYWENAAVALGAQSGQKPSDFARIVRTGAVDSAILLNGAGAVVYPSQTPMLPVRARGENDLQAAAALENQTGRLPDAIAAYARIAGSAADASTAARAMQGQIRCLLRSGNKSAAVRVIEEGFAGERLMAATDGRYRSIAADEQLLLLRLLRHDDTGYAPAAHRLAAMLNDYERMPIPSSQRLFLMNELRAAAPDAELPTLAAEKLAAQFAESRSAVSSERGLSERGLTRTRVAGLWQLPSSNGRIVGLYRRETVSAVMRAFLRNRSSSAGVEFAMIAPGEKAASESIAAGTMLPGWQISFTPVGNDALNATARLRRSTYLWIGYLMVASIAVTGMMAGHSFRKQMQLARLKTDLVAAVSHELKTPLSAMRLLVDSLREDTGSDPVRIREYLELISGENARLTRLIDNFLTFSRIERNRQQFEFAETRPEDVIESAVHAMRERLQDCRLEIQISPGLPAIPADRDALVTVLLNLLDNACKYTPADKRIAVRTYREAGSVIFAVEDNGIGIPPHEQKRIFRRFYQVDRRLARQTGGCGLGLSIVDFIVHAHSGTLRVESEAGAGSTFRVAVPCERQAL